MERKRNNVDLTTYEGSYFTIAFLATVSYECHV
jgi:hypothetical protein